MRGPLRRRRVSKRGCSSHELLDSDCPWCYVNAMVDVRQGRILLGGEYIPVKFSLIEDEKDWPKPPDEITPLGKGEVIFHNHPVGSYYLPGGGYPMGSMGGALPGGAPGTQGFNGANQKELSEEEAGLLMVDLFGGSLMELSKGLYKRGYKIIKTN